jgi:hypothetical protein
MLVCRWAARELARVAQGRGGREKGTTADLVAASLFVLLRRRLIVLPPEQAWDAPAGGRGL